MSFSGVIQSGVAWGAGAGLCMQIAHSAPSASSLLIIPTCYAIKRLCEDALPTRITQFTLRQRSINALTSGAKWGAFSALALSSCLAIAGPSGNSLLVTLKAVGTAITIFGSLGGIIGFVGDRSQAHPRLIPAELNTLSGKKAEC